VVVGPRAVHRLLASAEPVAPAAVGGPVGVRARRSPRAEAVRAGSPRSSAKSCRPGRGRFLTRAESPGCRGRSARALSGPRPDRPDETGVGPRRASDHAQSIARSNHSIRASGDAAFRSPDRFRLRDARERRTARSRVVAPRRWGRLASTVRSTSPRVGSRTTSDTATRSASSSVKKSMWSNVAEFPSTLLTRKPALHVVIST
jgi:hypothetical protein